MFYRPALVALRKPLFALAGLSWLGILSFLAFDFSTPGPLSRLDGVIASTFSMVAGVVTASLMRDFRRRIPSWTLPRLRRSMLQGLWTLALAHAILMAIAAPSWATAPAYGGLAMVAFLLPSVMLSGIPWPLLVVCCGAAFSLGPTLPQLLEAIHRNTITATILSLVLLGLFSLQLVRRGGHRRLLLQWERNSSKTWDGIGSIFVNSGESRRWNHSLVGGGVPRWLRAAKYEGYGPGIGAVVKEQALLWGLVLLTQIPVMLPPLFRTRPNGRGGFEEAMGRVTDLLYGHPEQGMTVLGFLLIVPLVGTATLRFQLHSSSLYPVSRSQRGRIVFWGYLCQTTVIVLTGALALGSCAALVSLSGGQPAPVERLPAYLRGLALLVAVLPSWQGLGIHLGREPLSAGLVPRLGGALALWYLLWATLPRQLPPLGEALMLLVLCLLTQGWLRWMLHRRFAGEDLSPVGL